MGLRDIFRSDDWGFVGKQLCDRYIENRRKKDEALNAHKRKLMYKDAGLELMHSMIDSMFGDPEVIQRHKAAADAASYDNVVRRVTRAISTLYMKPAKRTVEGDQNNRRYQEFQRTIRQDQMMRRTQEYVNLMNEVFVMPRVRAASGTPTMDVITRDRFRAIAHPTDPTLLGAIAIDVHQEGQQAHEPAWLVWSDDESVLLDSKCGVILESIRDNPFGRIPGVLAHREPPDGQLVDGTSGNDLLSGGLASWFVSVLLLKEAKSITRSTVWSGDLATTPSGQPQDTEMDNIAGEGVSIQTVDRGVDLRQFRETADHIIERMAANRGISPDVLRLAGASSGHEMDLRRIPIEELREQQKPVFRDLERELAEVQSIVLQTDLPEAAFSTDGWHIDFGEVDRHISEADKLRVRREKRSMGLSNPFSEALEDNPDFSEEQAKRFVLDNIDAQALFVLASRALNMPMDATVEDPGRSPEDNGAEGGESSREIQ